MSTFAKRVTISLLTVAVLLGVGSFFWLDSAKYFVGRASVTQRDFSVENSYLFVTPIRSKANNQEKIRITVFILNNQGLGVLGKKVVLGQDSRLQQDIIQATSDELGKAVFDISTAQAGEYYLDVAVEGKPLPQKAHLSFY